jgi:hypothetical protein
MTGAGEQLMRVLDGSERQEPLFANARFQLVRTHLVERASGFQSAAMKIGRSRPIRTLPAQVVTRAPRNVIHSGAMKDALRSAHRNAVATTPTAAIAGLLPSAVSQRKLSTPMGGSGRDRRRR